MSDFTKVQKKVEIWVDQYDQSPKNGQTEIIPDKKINTKLVQKYNQEILKEINDDPHLNDEEKTRALHHANKTLFQYVTANKMHDLLKEIAASCHQWSQSALCENLPPWKEELEREKNVFEDPNMKESESGLILKALSDYDNIPSIKSETEKAKAVSDFAKEAQGNFLAQVRSVGEYYQKALVQDRVAYAKDIVMGIHFIMQDQDQAEEISDFYALLDPRRDEKVIIAERSFSKIWKEDNHNDEKMELLDKISQEDSGEGSSKKYDVLIPIMLQQNKEKLEKLVGEPLDVSNFNYKKLQELIVKISNDNDAEKLQLVAQIVDQALDKYMDDLLAAGIPDNLSMLNIVLPHEYFHTLQNRHYKGEKLSQHFSPINPEDHYLLALNLYLQQNEREHPLAGTLRGVNILNEAELIDSQLEKRKADEKAAEEFGRNVARAIVFQRQAKKVQKKIEKIKEVLPDGKTALPYILWGAGLLLN
ncbi:MAG: hypothetical protein H7A32_05595 [Deltaproteobacteria bacterium]|nr:hypothetical protein [Deltaproteobacteria bacterium]